MLILSFIEPYRGEYDTNHTQAYLPQIGQIISIVSIHTGREAMIAHGVD